MYRDGDKIYMTKTELQDYRQDQRLQRSMQKAQYDMTTGLGNGVARDLGTTAAVGAGMIFSKRFRYIVQVPLHFFMGVCVVAFGLACVGVSGFTVLVLALVISFVWTGIYVALRTVPKWRALNR